MSAVWIVIGLVLFLALFSGKKREDGKSAGGPVRIDRPHAIDPEDSECSVCHRRFGRKAPVCPYCGVRFVKAMTDEEEWEEEEDELVAWDEEENL